MSDGMMSPALAQAAEGHEQARRLRWHGARADIARVSSKVLRREMETKLTALAFQMIAESSSRASLTG